MCCTSFSWYVLRPVHLQVGAGKRVFQLMDRTPQLPPSGNQKPTGSPAGAALEFRAVSFAYPSRPMSWVLKGFSLQVCASLAHELNLTIDLVELLWHKVPRTVRRLHRAQLVGIVDLQSGIQGLTRGVYTDSSACDAVCIIAWVLCCAGLVVTLSVCLVSEHLAMAGACCCVQVHPGQSVALVGSSGGGKSTVVKVTNTLPHAAHDLLRCCSSALISDDRPVASHCCAKPCAYRGLTRAVSFTCHAVLIWLTCPLYAVLPTLPCLAVGAAVLRPPARVCAA